MRYERSNLFTASAPSHAESQAKQVEMQFFGDLAQTAQKIADKASAKVGTAAGADAIETKAVTLEDGTTQYVPTYSEHPLAGFTAFGDAFNAAAEDAYRARVEADFYETSSRLQMENPADLDGFDKGVAAFEKAYFKGMNASQRAEALPAWQKLKSRSRATVQIAQQKKYLAANVATLDFDINQTAKRALDAYRSGDVPTANEEMQAYLEKQHRAGTKYLKDLDTIRKETEKFYKDVERQTELGRFERVLDEFGLATAMDMLEETKMEYLDPDEHEKLLDEAWNIATDRTRVHDEIQRRRDKRETENYEIGERIADQLFSSGELTNAKIDELRDQGLLKPTHARLYRMALANPETQDNHRTVMEVRNNLADYSELEIMYLPDVSFKTKSTLIQERRKEMASGQDWLGTPSGREAKRIVYTQAYGLDEDATTGSSEERRAAAEMFDQVGRTIRELVAEDPDYLRKNPYAPEDIAREIAERKLVENRRVLSSELSAAIAELEAKYPDVATIGPDEENIERRTAARRYKTMQQQLKSYQQDIQKYGRASTN